MNKNRHKWKDNANIFTRGGVRIVINGKTYSLDSREHDFWLTIGQFDEHFFLEWLLNKRKTSTSVSNKEFYQIKNETVDEVLKRYQTYEEEQSL
ncbi:TPA: hypothetical protein ACGU4W_001101 [Vibrio vulnificus]|nr:hypothetical protein [Vibrio vulnificus]